MFLRLISLPVVILMWPFRVAENRRVLASLSGLDDRGLADIGLTRQDLRDATAWPLGADPSRVFAERAAERADRAQRAGRWPPSPMAAE